jgi:uncharacterized lipoprotein YddW (UPF0748 family)
MTFKHHRRSYAPGFWVSALVLAMAAGARCVPAAFVPSNETPPPPSREFRGAWVATVNNIDWPSRPGLSTAQQQQELIALLDQAVYLRLNAILFQVRPACDAFYESRIEPWSEYLSGNMGQAPQPYYDPLALVIQEAHRRGLELHAWFNPFRARHHMTHGGLSPRHVAQAHPQWVRSYGRYLWLDPGDPAVQEYSLRVIMDVVQRYDIDGVHLDDYFYPYKEKDAKGRPIDFPDSPLFKRYQSQGGRLTREDWRREQVNTFVRRLYQAVKAEKAWVKLGISPFGIWRPGNPKGVEGLDAFAELYADSRKWWASGWVDYLAPQLYWPIDAREQSFPALLKWWADQNVQRRHLWPGLNTANVGTKYQPLEILNEIQAIRGHPAADGEIHWSVKSLLQNRQGLGDKLASGLYAQRVLVPSFPWLDRVPPARPTLSAEPRGTAGEVLLSWENGSPELAARWVIQVRQSGVWHTEIYPGGARSCQLPPGTTADLLAVTAVDRCGNLSVPSVLARTSSAPLPVATTTVAARLPTTNPTPSSAAPPRDLQGQSSDRSKAPRLPPHPVPGSSRVTGR